MAKFKIGARVRDEDGDEGVIVGKRKGERRVDYDEYGLIWRLKSALTPIAANDDTAEAERQIEVGDRVRCTQDYDPGNQFTAGEEYTVRYVTNESVGVVADDKGTENGWAREYFELVTEPATPEWQPKVGDRVRVTDGHGWDGDGVVVSVGSVTAGVTMDSGRFAGCTGGFPYRCLEPLPVAAEAQPADDDASVSDIFDELEAWLGDDNPVAVAPATTTPIKKRDLVTLAHSAMVTGFDPKNPAHAQVVLGTGGAYTLPVAALVPAA